MIRTTDGYRFSKKVLEEYNDPKNVGRMMPPYVEACITGPCGDTMEFYLNIKSGTVLEAFFYTDGCTSTIACGSILTQMAKGKRTEDAWQISAEDVLDALDGLPDDHVHCAKLAISTLRSALKKWENEAL